MELNEILDQRGSQYGDFTFQAACAQALKNIAHGHAQRFGVTLSAVQREALDMILHKVSRIVNGNPDNIDSWEDIGGYAKLVADRLKVQATAAAGEVSATAVEDAAAAVAKPFSGLENAFDVVDGPK